MYGREGVRVRRKGGTQRRAPSPAQLEARGLTPAGFLLCGARVGAVWRVGAEGRCVIRRVSGWDG